MCGLQRTSGGTHGIRCSQRDTRRGHYQICDTITVGCTWNVSAALVVGSRAPSVLATVPRITRTTSAPPHTPSTSPRQSLLCDPNNDSPANPEAARVRDRAAAWWRVLRDDTACLKLPLTRPAAPTPPDIDLTSDAQDAAQGLQEACETTRAKECRAVMSVPTLRSSRPRRAQRTGGCCWLCVHVLNDAALLNAA